jgi:thiosulfate dehydrogenase (quinone) large subunit
MIIDIWNDRIAGPKSPTNMQLGYLIMRLMLGVNLFMHGFIRLLTDYEVWRESTYETFIGAILPLFLVKGFLYMIPPVEVVLGVFLLLGLFTRSALLGSALLFLALEIGHGVRHNFGDMHVLMHFSVYLWALLAFRKLNWLALDNKMFAKI